MLGLVILGVYAVIGGILCCVAAQFPNARAIRSLDKLAAMLTGQRPPDTLAFLRYRQRMNRAAGFSFMLMGVWILAYAARCAALGGAVLGSHDRRAPTLSVSALDGQVDAPSPLIL